MREIVFLLEEPSAAEMLKGVLPRLLPDNFTPRYLVFEGKQDLERQMVRRMRGYNAPDALFVVMRDQDAGDCKKIKAALKKKCGEAGKDASLVRIVCRELESWYLADLAAVEKGLNLNNLARQQMKNPCRAPDSITCPSGYLRKMVPDYQKIDGSRRISPYLDLDNQRSKSFDIFIQGLRRIIGATT
jgi:hypothetical protein